ncbi:Bug family tripartite tricarboxylate transporter substrate binding protein [Noviherbaspirillum saxi]|uniref:Tripartite tricarboxylate transporter substrate binding protein n=1 Tax=Noviherbaspirillum saxi TaxID=2320863 RepID=A0A3A3FM23_9BURK|nr:tripartite tricarboxylate transporter substrate binding protein [Noviherbaspirillum saxi]RJF95535.1 tripartite tricarboxylate transporter substrate binding protein [Noviherbaspirillum saxi]
MDYKKSFPVYAAHLAAFTLAALTSVAHAQAWPTKTVTIISPYGPGGSNDISVRIIAKELEAKYGQPFVVENKSGAGTRIANDYVARARPDGYTLLWAAAPFAITASAGIKTSYDIHKNFVPVGPRVTGPVFLTVPADSPVRSVADFVKMAREKPGGVTFASPGIGSGPHLAAELFGIKGKFKVTNVHYRGDAAAYTDLVGGRVDAALTAITSALSHVKTGKLRVLGVASEARTPVYPDAPTFTEGGGPEVVGYGWFAFVAPAGTPAAIVQQLNRDANAVLNKPEITQKLIGLGLQPTPSTNSELGTFIDAEVQKWASVIKQAGVVLE